MPMTPEEKREYITELTGPGLHAISEYIKEGFPMLSSIVILIDDGGNCVIASDLTKEAILDAFTSYVGTHTQ